MIALRQEDLDDLSDEAHEKGVELLASMQDDGSIWLETLARSSGPRGSGAVALELLCSLADEKDARISLAVESDRIGVIMLYERNGFETMDDPDRRRDGHAVMVREPNC